MLRVGNSKTSTSARHRYPAVVAISGMTFLNPKMVAEGIGVIRAEATSEAQSTDTRSWFSRKAPGILRKPETFTREGRQVLLARPDRADLHSPSRKPLRRGLRHRAEQDSRQEEE